MSKRIFVTGGTGFIGAALVSRLVERGDRVLVLSRSASRARERLGDTVEIVEGDPTLTGPWRARLAGVDAVVNLAGASIAGKRWSARYKQLIHDSRVETTRSVVEAIAALAPDQRPSVLVSASGADYYPFAVELGAALPVDEDEEVTEDMPPGASFLARVCRNWEHEARAAESHGVRVVCMRTGVVLGDEGALARMTTPFKLFVGGPVGSGEQWFSWIHLDDAVRAYIVAMDQDTLAGPVNLVAPQTVRMRDFSKVVGKVMGRPSWLPVPGFAVKLAAGELAEYLLHGRRMVPAALQQHGFSFRYPALEPALRDAVG